jgi:hypothetical protein
MDFGISNDRGWEIFIHLITTGKEKLENNYRAVINFTINTAVRVNRGIMESNFQSRLFMT